MTTSYKFIRQLGAGGFGSVYLVENNDKNYAMKLIDQKGSSYAQAYEEYTTGKLINSKIKSGGVPRYYEFLDNLNYRGKLYYGIVMEHIVGQELFDFIHNEKQRFSESRVVSIIKKIATILEILHQNNLVYRDLKPENIMISSDDVITLIDLGAVCSSKNLDNSTGCGEYVCGTPVYVPYDILIADKYESQKSKAADVYSLGMIFYQFYHKLKDLKTFESLTKTQEYLKRNKGQLPLSYSGIPKRSAEIIRKMLDKNYNKRPTMTQIKDM